MVWLLLVPGVALAGLLALWLLGERGRLILPSTRAALKRSPSDGKRGSALNTVHGYIYGRWPYHYIDFYVHKLLPRASPELKRWWADRYHGKVLPTELARRIVTLDHEIKRTDLERIIPYPIARDIVLTGPPNVVLLDCPCRAAHENPCQPTDVCMIVGDGSFVLDHHPGRSRRIDQAEALAVLEAEHERGHVHTAYFKDACGGRFFAICNCCRCCCGGLEAMIDYGVPMVAASGYVAQVDWWGCVGCGDCETACPFDAITLEPKATVSWERCMGCGVCEGRCELGAIGLVPDERKGLPLDVWSIGVEAPAVVN